MFIKVIKTSPRQRLCDQVDLSVIRSVSVNVQDYCKSNQPISLISPVLGDPNVTAFLKALSLHRFCSTCTPTNCQLHMAKNSFTLTTYVSPFKTNTSANWNAVFRQIWRGCHTSIDSGDLNQAPPKQSAVCSTCIIPVLPVNCQFIWIWMACAFGMSATQPILG